MATVLALSTYLALGRPLVQSNKLSESDQTILTENFDDVKRELFGEYALSNEAEIVYQGDKFPHLSLPRVAGPPVDWNSPAVVTLGTSISSSALDLYSILTAETTPIQKIHILSRGSYTGEELSEFPPDVTILNGMNQEQAVDTISKTLYEALGVYVQTSGYLIDSDNTILYAKVNHGGFGDLASAALAFTSGGRQAVVPNSQQPLASGTVLSMDGMDVSAEARVALESELSKDTTIILLSNKKLCDVCNSWLSDADRFLTEWRNKGYGVILVESNPNQATFSTKTLRNGALEVLDKTDGAGSTLLFSEWGVNIYPVFYILKDGAFQGQVAYLETSAFGNTYRDVPFEVVDAVTQDFAAQ